MESFSGLGMRTKGYRFAWQETVCRAARSAGYIAFETFSGPGGMSLGLQWAGFNVPVAFDADARAVETHNLNLGGHCYQLDARCVSGEQLRELSKAGDGDIALVSGGPPCQGFSKQRRGAHLGDDRNDLVLEYVRLVKEIRPRFFLFENVAIFGQKRGRVYIAEIAKQLNEYQLYSGFFNAADYGLPQTRERFVIVGKRSDVHAHFKLPVPTQEKWRTVGEVLEGLPEPSQDYSDHPLFPNHQRARVTQANIDRFSHVPQGGGWQDIPMDLRLKCHQVANVTQGGWPDVYGRLRWDAQCPTITGGFDSFTRGRYGHPIQNRPLTPREAARIQGFPDKFVFCGTRGDIRSQIGNVVPPPLAEALALSILASLLHADGIIESDIEQETDKVGGLQFALI